MFRPRIQVPGRGIAGAGNTAGRSTVDPDKIPHRVFETREGEVLSGMREVSMSEFVRAHTAGAAVIDVGEVEEYNRGHVPGAVSLPLGDLSRDLTAARCRIRRDAPVYVVCTAGNRSLIATGMLMHAGYDAFSVLGGTNGWVKTGHPVVGGDRVRY
jgi:rhodanese-related sulfurtransferase